MCLLVAKDVYLHDCTGLHVDRKKNDRSGTLSAMNELIK